MDRAKDNRDVRKEITQVILQTGSKLRDLSEDIKNYAVAELNES